MFIWCTDHSLEICKLLKYSPKKDAIFHKLYQELSPQVPEICNLCPTRWTVCVLSLDSICLNYTTLEATWNETSEVATQSEVKSKINVVSLKVKEFDFLFVLMLAESVLKHTDNLSKTIQATEKPAVEANGLSKLFKKTRTEECFDQFWELTKSTQCLLNIKDPTLPQSAKSCCSMKMVLEMHIPVLQRIITDKSISVSWWCNYDHR